MVMETSECLMRSFINGLPGKNIKIRWFFMETILRIFIVLGIGAGINRV
jgi:hypothetical protein